MKRTSSRVGRWPAAGLLLWLLLLLAGPAARAQAPAWQTAVAAGQSIGSYSQIQATVVGANGSVYVAGTFRGSMTLGSATLFSSVGNDVFVARWNPIGGFVWALRAGGTGEDYATAVAVSGNNVYVAGYFTGTATFGSTISLASVGNDDAFVAKLTDGGSSATFVWAQRAGGTGYDKASSLAVSGSNVYMAGYFDSAPATFGLSVLSSVGNFDVFVAKLQDGGAVGIFVWAQRAGGPGIDFANALAVAGTRLYVAGAFDGVATFSGAALTSAGSSDAFVARLDDTPGGPSPFVWARRAGGAGGDFANGVGANGTSVYMAGAYSSAAPDFGSSTLVNSGSYDLFVAKLTDTGPATGFTWVQRAGGTGNDQARALAASGTNVLVAGAFDSPTIAFGSTTLSAGSSDVFVSKLTDQGAGGTFAWTRQAGGTSTDQALAVAVGGTGVYVSGTINPPAMFGFLALNSSVGSTVAFLASLTDPTLTATAAPLALAGLALAPNPAHATAIVRLSGVPGATAATLTLLDALGRAVRTQQVALPAAGATADISVAGLAPGLYRLRVQAGGLQTSRALAVE